MNAGEAPKVRPWMMRYDNPEMQTYRVPSKCSTCGEMSERDTMMPLKANDPDEEYRHHICDGCSAKTDEAEAKVESARVARKTTVQGKPLNLKPGLTPDQEQDFAARMRRTLGEREEPSDNDW